MRLLAVFLTFFAFHYLGYPSDFVTVCRSGLNKPILDHQTTLDTILVTLPPNSRVLDINIRIDSVLHTYDSDLRFYLMHSGAGVSFIRNVGLGGDNFIFTNINDSAACAIGSSSGREIVEPVNELLKPGTYEIQWDASDLPSGIYYYRLETAYFRETKKMLLIK